MLPHLSSVLRTGCGQSEVARWSCRSHPGAGSVAEQMRPPFPSSPGRGGVDPGGHSSAPGPSSHAFTQLTVTTAREWRTRPWKPSGPKSLAAAPAGSLHVSRLKGKDTRRALIAGVMPERQTGPVRIVGQPEHLCRFGPRLAAGLEGRGWRPPWAAALGMALAGRAGGRVGQLADACGRPHSTWRACRARRQMCRWRQTSAE